MKRVLITLRSKNPGYLMNPVTPELLEQIRTKTSPPRRRDWTPYQEASTKLGKGDEYGLPEAIGIPANNLFACLRQAGRMVKNGRTQISTATGTKLPMYVELEDEFLPFKGDDVAESWVPVVMRGTNPNGGEMVALTRPLFKRWEVDVSILFDEKKINDKVVQELFEIAGAAYGLGDFRPERGGRFGRFVVAAWVDQGKVQTDEFGVVVTAGNGHAELSQEELATATA